MSPAEFKKTLCRPVEFKGQGPNLLFEALQLVELPAVRTGGE